jgi:hypothetical protein
VSRIRVLDNDNVLIHKWIVLGELTPKVHRMLGCLDSILLMRRLSFLVNARPTYRAIVLIEKRTVAIT